MVRIIAQGQFDVNKENIEGAVLVGSSTGNRMVFSCRMRDLVSVSEDRGIDRDILYVSGCFRAVPISRNRDVGMNLNPLNRFVPGQYRRNSLRLRSQDHQREVA